MFTYSNLSILDIISEQHSWIFFRKSILIPISSTAFSLYCSNHFKVSRNTLWSLIHINWILSKMRGGSSLILLHVDINFIALFLKSTISFLKNVFYICHKSVGPLVLCISWEFYLILLNFMFTFETSPCYFYDSIIWNQKLW